jgi:hypothetical protein
MIQGTWFAGMLGGDACVALVLYARFTSFRIGRGDGCMLLEQGRRMMSINNPMLFDQPPPIEGLITKRSPFSVDETLPRLEEAIRSRSIKLFVHCDLDLV